MSKKIEPDKKNANIVLLIYSGNLADSGKLDLREYADSLSGWQDLFQTLGELYLRSIPEFRTTPVTNLLRTEIISEEAGSYRVEIAFEVLKIAAEGIVAARSDAVLIWSFRKLLAWYRDIINSHVKAKSRSTDIDAVVAALELMTEKQGITLDAEITQRESESLFVDTDASPEDALPTEQPTTKARALVERIDAMLKSATEPIPKSCERIILKPPNGKPLLEFGAEERAVIVAPLTAPPPTGTWKRVKIKFERINRKTGRALFYFEGEDDGPTATAHYSRIVDTAVHRPGNVFTRAFNEDALLEVWIRQVAAEQGRLNLQWEISENPPAPTLWDTPQSGQNKARRTKLGGRPKRDISL